ncbi:hypothetical protein WMF27_33735 [Sorangium sp. So ce281]|uniref:hypothetical protein n=1 Tax=unclassified Sorangium TaxID=2621164 RepID=UPI003F62150F
MRNCAILSILALVGCACCGVFDETTVAGKNGSPQPERAAPITESAALDSMTSEGAEEEGDVAMMSIDDEEGAADAPTDEPTAARAPFCVDSVCNSHCRTIEFRRHKCYAGGRCKGGTAGFGATCTCFKFEGGGGRDC